MHICNPSYVQEAREVEFVNSMLASSAYFDSHVIYQKNMQQDNRKNLLINSIACTAFSFAVTFLIICYEGWTEL